MPDSLEEVGKRVAGEYNMHRLADPIGSIGQWFAVRLSDGSSDHVLYPDKISCVLHQKGDEKWYAYLQIIPATMTERDAMMAMSGFRKLADAGITYADPDHKKGGVQPITRLTREDQRAGIRAQMGRGKPTNLIVDRTYYK
jgi:hypothetical protein